ncbi:C2H2 finger domain-containing protein [Ceratocystis lukuohia]|uniref:C2H2 finger domain-containing protein n=1 Tax=Ceratocystis lukuohia TaxID=2019550 RepID=A0ABR4MI04_9PEZI
MDPPQKRRKLAPKVPQPPSSSPSQANSHTIPAPAAAAVAAETGSVPARVEFERFARHLQDAAMMIQRSAERPNYTSVSALLVRWEDDVAAEDDIVAVEKVLREQYSFETEQWHIPSVANASLKLGVQVTEFLKNSKPDSLLIFYYAGHGFVAPDDQVYWACNTNDDSPKLKWDGIRYLFEDSQSDVLFLLDTCIASATIPPQSGNMGVKQVIAANTAEFRAREPGKRSFSSYLCESLHVFASTKTPFSIQSLYEDVVARQRVDLSSSAPNGDMGLNTAISAATATNNPSTPVCFTTTQGKWPNVVLSSALADGVSPPCNLSQLKVPKPDPEQPRAVPSNSADNLSITPEAVVELKFDEPRVLACTTFVGEASSDMTFFNTWLAERPEIADMVAVEAMFFGPPTMLLISMAMPIWEVVRHDKVCIFLGYIGSHNFVHLYQNLVGFTGSRRTQNTVSKEVEDGRILLEAHEAAKRNSIVGEEIAAPETPFRKVTLAREGATVSSDDPMQEVHYQSKDDVEESAEMKEAAEQLKALSHTRHPIPDATLTPQQQNRRRSTLPDSAPERREDGLEPEIKQEETPESATRPKAQRRSIPKAAPRNDTRCTLCSHLPFKDSSSLRKHIAAAHTRPFPCAFSFAGCSSTFGSKNEWKRHIASQHLCLQYYRCSACPASAAEGKFNEFNRKDLFTQHLRRMHAPFAIKKNAGKADARLQADWEATVKEMQQSCLVQRRLPPQRSACPKADCQSIFEGSTSWDEWTEHVGRHMEKSEAQGMGIDRNLAKWALDERIIERDENGEYKLVPDVTYSGRHHEHHHQPITLPTVAASTTVADAPSTSASVATGSGAGRAIALDSPTSVAGGATGPGSGAAVAAVAAVAGSSPSDQKRKRSDWRGELVPLGSMEIDEGA